MAYTKRDKNTCDSEIFFSKPDKWFKIRFYIVGEVQWKDYKQRKRGENWFSYEKIASATGASKQQIRKCLEWLRDRSMIETFKETRGLTIKVLNYAKYQDIKKGGGDRWETDGRHGGDTEVDTIEEEEKNKRKKWSLEQKEKIWKTYPHARKGKKQEALKYIIEHDYEVVLHTVNIYKWEVYVGMQNARYVPGCQLRCRDFVPYSEMVAKNKLKEIYNILLEGRKTEEIKQFTNDFGQDFVMELYNERSNEQQKLLLSGLQ